MRKEVSIPSDLQKVFFLIITFALVLQDFGMRISIPSIPESVSQNARKYASYDLQAATDLVAGIFQRYRGKTLIMTGAGVSVDSGIAPYRGKDGHYTVHKSYRPIFFHEFIDQTEKGHAYRQRYWSRSFLGFPPVLRAKPNKTHYSMAALQRLGYFDNIITQNVDSLHHLATPSASLAASSILELHGTLQNVVCVASPIGTDPERHAHHHAAPIDQGLYDRLSQSHLTKGGPRKPPEPQARNTPVGRVAYPKGCGYRGSRAAFQAELAQNNPQWDKLAHDMEKHGTQPKTNPDGDVELGKNTDYSSFQYSPCPQCGGILKPAVVFFGESVPDIIRDHSFELVNESEAFILMGTSLATYSAYRLLKSAQEQGKQTLLINVGPTRGDPIVDDKIEIGSSDIMHAVATQMANSRAEKDPILRRLLDSGETIVPNQRRGVVSS